MLPEFAQTSRTDAELSHEEFAARLAELMQLPGVGRYLVIAENLIPGQTCQCGRPTCSGTATRHELRVAHNFGDLESTLLVSQQALALIAYQWDPGNER